MRLTDQEDDDLAEQIRHLTTAILERRVSLDRLVGLTDDKGNLQGPFACLPFSPAIGMAVQELGAEIRSKSALTAAAAESAILTVARKTRADFEWFAHERVALSSDALTLDDISRLGRGDLPWAEPAKTASRIAGTLLDVGTLTDGDYEQGLRLFGERGLVELVILVGYYHLLALLNVTFDTPIVSSAKLPWKREPAQADNELGRQN